MNYELIDKILLRIPYTKRKMPLRDITEENNNSDSEHLCKWRIEMNFLYH